MVSAKVDGKKVKCTVKVVKDIVKESAYINNICNTWYYFGEKDKRVAIKKGKVIKGLTQLLAFEPTGSDQEVAYKKCNKIMAVAKNGELTEIYFNATGILSGKKSTKYACVVSLSSDSMILQAPYVFEGEKMYGAGSYWYGK